MGPVKRVFNFSRGEVKRKYVLTRGGGGSVVKRTIAYMGGGGDPIFDIFMRTYYVNGPPKYSSDVLFIVSHASFFIRFR